MVVALPMLQDRQLQRDEGISNFEYSVLARLSMTETRTMRLSDLAAQCESTQPRLSKLMVHFEQQGWVTRSSRSENWCSTPLSAAQQRHLRATLAPIAALVREQLDGR